MSDVTFSLRSNDLKVHHSASDRWIVTLVDTGDQTQTGGRLGRVREHVADETFCFTYGDGLCDVNIRTLLEFHSQRGTRATLTAIQQPGRFGVIDFEEEKIRAFQEKPPGDGGWVNGGFFVLEPKVFDYISGYQTAWEREPLERLAREGQLSASKHTGS